MRKLALIGATVVGAVVLSASPISVKWSADRNLSVSPGQGGRRNWKTWHARKRRWCRTESRPTSGAALRNGCDLLGSLH